MERWKHCIKKKTLEQCNAEGNLGTMDINEGKEALEQCSSLYPREPWNGGMPS
jgi:hypothetical protein